MANPAKELRGQLRQIVIEVLPSILRGELGKTLRDELLTEITARLNNISANVKESLEKIDERSKDIQNMVLRDAIARQAPVATDEKVDATAQAGESVQTPAAT